MKHNADSKEVAEALEISRRHARRLIAARDPRLEPVNHESFNRFARRRQSQMAWTRSTTLAEMAKAIRSNIGADTLVQSDADRLTEISKRLDQASADLLAICQEWAE